MNIGPEQIERAAKAAHNLKQAYTDIANIFNQAASVGELGDERTAQLKSLLKAVKEDYTPELLQCLAQALEEPKPVEPTQPQIEQPKEIPMKAQPVKREPKVDTAKRDTMKTKHGKPKAGPPQKSSRITRKGR